MYKNTKLIFSIIVIVILGLTLIFIVQKNTKNKKIMINGEYRNTESISKIDSQVTLNKPEEVVYNFYKYYLQNVYKKITNLESPEIKLNKYNIYELDSTQHIKFLKESGYFSSQFYENELPVFKTCNDELKKLNVQEVKDSGGSPSVFTNGACNFLDAFQWVGGQGEELNIVNILQSEIIDNNAKVVVIIGKKLNNQYSYNYSYPVVNLEKESDEWKIININLSFERPSK